jgi:hypothetical protein
VGQRKGQQQFILDDDRKERRGIIMVKKDVEIQRKATAVIIATKPASLTLNRTISGDDGSGGVLPEKKVSLPTQTICVYEVSNSQSDELMEQGSIPSHIVGILGAHDADIKKGDRFAFQGGSYEVQYARPTGLGGDGKDCIFKISGRAKEITELA